MFSDRSIFTNFSDIVVRWVETANEILFKVEGIGYVRVCLLDTDGKGHFVTFSNCLLVPNHAQNLISVSKLSQKGVEVEFGKESKMVAPNLGKLSNYQKRKSFEN